MKAGGKKPLFSSGKALETGVKSESAEGGNRTHTFLRTPDFESGKRSPQTIDHKSTSGDAINDLAFCLALLAKKSADLALLAERWESLPEAVRVGIIAMVKAASPR